ncbi:MAG: replicative DNA helicase [Clostridia bacterium]|jgi:replicative DNA helicase|nr:replicative DNA helicase [Clostridia bacterium]MBT7123075.1 replicative DNA helicase [Clostridia bacterium]
MDQNEHAAYVPPNNIEAEKSVLGSMFLDPKAVFIAIERLRPEDFYSKRNSEIFECMGELSETGNPIDTVTVVDKLERKKLISEPDEMVYIADLANSVPSASNILYYIEIVEQKSLLRALVSIGNDIVRDAMSSEDETADIVNRAGDLIYKITVKRNRDSLEHIKQALVDGYNLISESSKNKSGLLGIPTGFKQLDNMLSGLQGSQLIIIAGRPGVGKTSIALNIAQHAAIKANVPIAMFSLEMSKEQLALRMMCSEALVNSEKIRHGNVSDDDFDRLSIAVKSLAGAPIYVDDTPTITVMEMLAKARRLKQEKGLGLVVIDYLQLMTGGSRRENRQQEVSGMTRSLKIMAKEINVPIVLLSQLSREVEKRESKRPQLSDLRESGSIEQDADVVVFLSKDAHSEEQASNEVRVIVAKQRSGPTGDFILGYRGEFTRFNEIGDH